MVAASPSWWKSAGRTNPTNAITGKYQILPSRQFFPYLGGIEVHFSHDMEKRPQQVALANGKDAEQLVKDTVAHMLESQARFVAGVEKGIVAAERGELIDHEDVVKRINRLLEP